MKNLLYNNADKYINIMYNNLYNRCMIYATQLPPTYIFEDLNINESIYYSLFYRFYITSQKNHNIDSFIPDHSSLDATVQALNPHLSRVTLTSILRSLKSKNYIHPTELIPLINPSTIPNPPITNQVITTKKGRPSTKK